MKRRVLSLWQPWASFLVVTDPLSGRPPKGWETRHWMPRQNSPIDIAIHATKRFEGGILNTPDVIDLHRRLGPIEMPRGVIIGVATITVVVPVQEVVRSRNREHFGDRLELALGDYTPGRYAWCIENAIALPQPIPFKGNQSALYLLDPATEFEIDRQLGLPVIDLMAALKASLADGTGTP